MSNIPSNFTDGAVTITDDGGHSATLAMPMGDQALTGLLPAGRALVKTESQGALVGLRKGARAYPQFTVSAVCGPGIDAFKRMCLGTTSGFVSVTLGIGDYPAFDMSYTFNYGAESRSIAAQDVVCLGIEHQAGETSTVSYTFEIQGPLTIDGETIIASR